MTLQEMKNSKKEYLIADEVAQVLGCSPHIIRVQAHKDKSLLGFPVIVMGSRVKIPRKPFIQFIEGV